jgi:hypothetical protein
MELGGVAFAPPYGLIEVPWYVHREFSAPVDDAQGKVTEI